MAKARKRTTKKKAAETPSAPTKPRRPKDAGVAFPKALYREMPKSDRYPNGYEARRVVTAAEEAALLREAKRQGIEWHEHPDDVPGVAD